MKRSAKRSFAILCCLWVLGCALFEGWTVFWTASVKALVIVVLWSAARWLWRIWYTLSRSVRSAWIVVTVFAATLTLAWQLAGNDHSRHLRDGASILAGIALGAMCSSFRRPKQPPSKGVTQSRDHVILGGTFVLISVLAGWIIASVWDRASQRAIKLYPARFTNGEAGPSPIRIGLALSGGGYRAAIYHAGVLTALEKLGLRPVCLSSVSGGSIMSTFYAHGGRPRDFVKAVEEGRFSLKRELLNFFTATKLICPGKLPWLGVKVLPFGDYTRLDAQADLLDRLILRGSVCGSPMPKGSPRLVVCMTDVSHGWQLGCTDVGLLIDGTARDRVLPGAPNAFPTGERWARLVALSGAFPGAFPISPRRLKLGSITEGMIIDVRTMAVDRLNLEQDPFVRVSLADGGIIENLGLRLLLVAHRHAKLPGDGPGVARNLRFPSGKVTGPAEALQRYALYFGSGFRELPSEWRLDVALFSNGGQMLASREDGRSIGLGRVIDIATSLHAARDEEALRFSTQFEATNDIPVYGLSPAYLGDPPDLEMLGGENAAAARKYGRRTAQPLWFLNEMLEKQGILDQVLEINPHPEKARTELAALRVHWKALDNATEEERRAAGRSFSDEHPVLRDVSTGLTAFDRTSTLEDQVPPEDAEAIFRLGQYSVYLRFDRLKMILDAASEKRKTEAK
jgi:hypothetical protein